MSGMRLSQRFYWVWKDHIREGHLLFLSRKRIGRDMIRVEAKVSPMRKTKSKL